MFIITAAAFEQIPKKYRPHNREDEKKKEIDVSDVNVSKELKLGPKNVDYDVMESDKLEALN